MDHTTTVRGFPPTVSKRALLFSALVILVAVVVAYCPVVRNGFLQYDDPLYVTANDMVRHGLTSQGIAWAFTTTHTGNWHPLTWLSHMLDVELFGLYPLGHHLVNVVLHGLNALLLLAILLRTTGRVGRSLTVALLFVVHPLHVESVAWVAERKDVLSALFGLAAIWSYLYYAAQPCRQRYLPVVAFFAFSLMSKSMLVTLPLLLLILDYWPLGRLTARAGEFSRTAVSTLVMEKLPLILLSAAAAAVAFFSQLTAGSVNVLDQYSLVINAGNACLSYVTYLWLMIWPAKLAVFYPFDSGIVTPLRVAAAACLLAGLTAVAVRQRGVRPYLLTGWLWYLVTLLPVIGLVRIGSQALADRYTYVPLVGIFVLLVWGGAELAERLRIGTKGMAVATSFVIALLAATTMVQLGYWRSNADLFRHTLAVTENNWVAHNNYGVDLMTQRQFAEGTRNFQEAVRINPNYAEAYRNLGDALVTTGDIEQGIAALRKAVTLWPGYAKGHLSLGYAYLMAGEPDRASEEYRQLLGMNPEDAAELQRAIGKGVPVPETGSAR